MNVDFFPLSLLTITLFMNTTVYNQGNHCIVALSLMPGNLVDTGNTSAVISNDQCRSLLGQVAAPVQGAVIGRDYYATRASLGGSG